MADPARGRALSGMLAVLGGWIVLRTTLVSAAGGWIPAVPALEGVAAKLRRSEALAAGRGPVFPAALVGGPALLGTVPRAPTTGQSTEPVRRHARRQVSAHLADGLRAGAYTHATRAAALPLPLGKPGLRFSSPEFAQPLLRAAATLVPLPRPAEQLWSGDAWLLIRAGGVTGLAAPAGSYGGSQVGLMVRRRIAGTGATPLSAYVRAASALEGSSREGAVGLSWRPAAHLPVSVSAEVRVRAPGGLVPAIGISGGGGPIALPARFRLEAYGQAGALLGRRPILYGDAAATVTRPVARLGRAWLSAGVGAWAGGQTGTARLDVGPRIELRLPATRGLALSVALDWRERALGSARPGSGPALTLSTGF